MAVSREGRRRGQRLTIAIGPPGKDFDVRRDLTSLSGTALQTHTKVQGQHMVDTKRIGCKSGGFLKC